MFEGKECAVRAFLTREDLERVRGNVIASGELSQRDIGDFFRE